MVPKSTKTAVNILQPYRTFGRVCTVLVDPFTDLVAAVRFGLIKDGVLNPETGDDNNNNNKTAKEAEGWE